MVQPADESSDVSRLVEAAPAGDRAAFGRLYERYGRMVHGILLSRVPPGEVADLVQDVFLLAMRRLHSLREPAAFGGWLMAIARNRANDFHRRSPNLEELDEHLRKALAGATDGSLLAKNLVLHYGDSGTKTVADLRGKLGGK